ncbi:eukaryotic initiation factor-2, alpha subunit [Cardiosporidium cionae]|uniref:Eukaryotic initiation factor-2, alpha subunit n=1 Tax=Cardiosporidium cionae TaxID=476202 RepID=A0ABQ7JC86_9APIC|nr:eukaryotic initiation factor-2, alpha subunit [Cardiosporidium cionae]|eukprot:KAF8821648.1 eukaryotic initiation factor-2, alpha subunit [Cardiosporidium cionae]
MNSTQTDPEDCRFYEAKFPEPEDLVMVKVEHIEDIGAYVSLLEYNNMQGMILMSELSKVRFRSVNRLIRVGRREVVMVLRVDSKKGYIDLSKRRVSPEDIVKCEERFLKSKKVHQTINHVAQRNGIKVEELNRKITWPLYKKYGHAFDALKEATQNPEAVFEGLDITEEIRQSIMRDVQMRLAPQALKLRAKIDVWCFGYDGIDAVKDALSQGKKVGDDKVSIAVKLIAPPQYVVLTTCFDKQRGMEIISEALKIIQTTIKKYKGGEFKQQGDIIVMGREEERKLEELLEEQQELLDEESSEEDEGMGYVKEEEVAGFSEKREDTIE